MMNQLFFNLLDHSVVMKHNETLVCSASFSKHIGHLYTVLQHMHEKYLCDKLEKCAFLQNSVEYLGNIVSAGSIWANPVKLEAIYKWLILMYIKYI